MSSTPPTIGANAVLNCAPDVPKQIPSVPEPFRKVPVVAVFFQHKVVSVNPASLVKFGATMVVLTCKLPTPGSVVVPTMRPAPTEAPTAIDAVPVGVA